MLIVGGVALADDAADVHGAIGAMADALSDGDAALAISSLSKSCADYQKLGDDFHGLAEAYAIHNSIGFVDEDISANSAAVTVQWDMNLMPVQSALSTNRSAELTIKLAREGKNWRITGIMPNKIFEP